MGDKNNERNIIYKHFFENSDKGNIFIENNKIIDCNKAAVDMLGYSSKINLIGQMPFDLPLYKQSPNINNLQKTQEMINDLQFKEKYVFDWVIQRKDGKELAVEAYVTKLVIEDRIILCVSLRDITRRKWIEKFLRESEERNRRLVELLPEPIILQRQGRIIYTNRAAVKFLGLENRHSLIGKNILDFIEIYSDENKNYIKKKLKGKINNFSLFNEISIIRKSDNKVLEIEIASTVFSYSNKKATLILLRDLSDRRKAEKYIKLFKEAMEYDKLKTQFFANLSHELRTPLNVILGTIQLLMIYITENPSTYMEKNIYNRIKVLKQNCYRLLRLVNNLIDITKIDAGYYELELQNENIVNIVEEITLSVAEYIEQRSINLIFDTNIEEKIIACDPDKIERIILNLLSNAIKFTDPGGKIFVNIYDKGELIRISVKDTGIGIPKDEIENIFEHFRQVDKSFTRSHEGSGIGLSLVKSLVEMHGGSITVESEYGKGSEFLIEFPVRVLETEKNIIKETRINNPKDNHVEIIDIEFSDIYS